MNAVVTPNLEQNVINSSCILLAERLKDTKNISLLPTSHRESQLTVPNSQIILVLSGKGKITKPEKLCESSHTMKEIKFDENTVPFIINGYAQVKVNPNSDFNYKIIKMEQLSDEDVFIIGKVCGIT